MTDPNDFQAFIKAYAEKQELQRKAANEQFSRTAVPALAKAGVRKIDIEYSGSGDSGGIDVETYYGDEDNVVPADKIDDKTKELVHDYVYRLLPGGFEAYEGGQGVLKIDVVNGTYKLHHQENVMEHVDHDTEGKF